MKKIILITIGFFLISTTTFAVKGTCSSHGGVECSYGSDYDGSAICSDGWRDSSELFFTQQKCIMGVIHKSLDIVKSCSSIVKYVEKEEWIIDDFKRIVRIIKEDSNNKIKRIKENYSTRLDAQKEINFKNVSRMIAYGLDSSNRDKNNDHKIKNIEEERDYFVSEAKLITNNFILPYNICLEMFTDKIDFINQRKEEKESFLKKNHLYKKGDNYYCILGYTLNAKKDSCLKNIEKKEIVNSNEEKECKTGYFLKKNKCITHTEDCKNFFGENVTGIKGAKKGTSSCDCSTGYKWNTTKTKCLISNNTNYIKKTDSIKKFSGNKCSADLIMYQNLRAPKSGQKYIRNGNYDSYSKGNVKEAHILQKHLNRLGFSAGKVDGIIGPNTRGAILRLQKYLGTKQDGYVGPKTRALLNNSCNQKNSI